jgi:hypothetical protein
MARQSERVVSMVRTLVAGALLLGGAGVAVAGESTGVLHEAMQTEIKIAWDGIQKTTDSIGCLVTATGHNEPALTRILDTLNAGEVRLREARRLAQSAASDAERAQAIEHARASLALVLEAETALEQSGLN